jgi:hypothetical protein
LRPILACVEKKPQPLRWDIYRVAGKGKLLGTGAVKKAAEEFKTDTWRLIAAQRR